MSTVFSHIIQKRFSKVNEDVATDALAYILNSSESAHRGMMKFIRSIESTIPELQFQTQQMEDNMRPDIWGIDKVEPRVFIENKFWAGLTDNQPVSYLQKLSEYPSPTILFVVGPEARFQTLWRELRQRLNEEHIDILIRDDIEDTNVIGGNTSLGSVLVLTTWKKILSILELEGADDKKTMNDLLQLRSLCESADIDAFLPVTSFEVSDQRTPTLILQLGLITQASIDLAVTKEIINIKGFMPKASWNQVGRYATFKDKDGIGFWFGVHFDLWKEYGVTPLWLVFPSSDWGRASDVKPLLEPWATKESIFTSLIDSGFVVAIDVSTGEEKDQVVRNIVDLFEKIAENLSSISNKDEL